MHPRIEFVSEAIEVTSCVLWFPHSRTWLHALPTCLLNALLWDIWKTASPQNAPAVFLVYSSLCRHASSQLEGQSFSASFEPRQDFNPLIKIPHERYSSLYPKLGQKGDMFLPDPKPASPVFLPSEPRCHVSRMSYTNHCARVHWPAPRCIHF